MNELLTQVGLGGLIAVLVIREVLTFLKEKKNGHPPLEQIIDRFDALLQRLVQLMEKSDTRLAKIESQTNELHTWHDKEGEDGVKLWYVRGALKKKIDATFDAVEEQKGLITNVCKTLSEEIKQVGRKIEGVCRLVEKCDK